VGEPSHPGTSGTFQIQWAQSGQIFFGTITITETPCISEGAVSGALNGKEIEFGAIQGGQGVAYTGTGPPTPCRETYESPTCNNAEGTWEAPKSS
jgi:hypothetical protein